VTPDDNARIEAARLRHLLNVPRDPKKDFELTPHDSALLSRILAPPSAMPSQRRQRGRVPVGVRISVACASIAAVVVAGVVVQSQTAPAAATPAMLEFTSVSVGQIIAGQSASARPALQALASVAATQPVGQHDGKQVVKSYAWFWTNTVSNDGTSEIELAPTFQTTAIGPDGSFSNQEVRAPALDAAGGVINPNQYPAGGSESKETFPAGSIDPEYPTTLPRDPQALRSALIAAEGGEALCSTTPVSEAGCLYNAILSLYTRWVIPSDLTAALWSTLADEPALVDMGRVIDRLGRTGQAIAIPPDPTTRQIAILIIDPGSGNFLASERIADSVPDLDLDEPAVIGFQAIASAEWTRGE
jgi:hypothetical protein